MFTAGDQSDHINHSLTKNSQHKIPGQIMAACVTMLLSRRRLSAVRTGSVCQVHSGEPRGGKGGGQHRRQRYTRAAHSLLASLGQAGM